MNRLKQRLPNWAYYFKWPLYTAVLFAGLFLIGLVIIVFGGRFVVDEQALVLDEMSTVETKDGQLIERIYTKNRENISIDHIPQHVLDAFIAIEDNRFYEHNGVDVKSIMRALYRDIIAMEKVEGGSTITQQLSKNLFLSNDKTWMRKTKEVMAAFYLERNYSKNEILELYLNRIYFGAGTYGIEAASHHYFGTSVSDLTVPQGALLAGLPKAPNSYSPLNHPEAAKQRRNLVLARMEDLGMIPSEKLKRMQGATLAVSSKEGEDDTWSNSYVDLVINEAADKYHISRDELKRGGYRIIVEMDPVVQRTASEQMKNGAFVPGSNGEVQGALTLMDHSTGALVAAVGGRDFKHGDLNQVITKHQPASVIKPLAVYGPALMTERYEPFTLISDEKQKFEGGFEPSNHDNRYEGSVSIYEAIIESKNVSAVWLLNQIGIPYAKEYLEKMDLKTKDNGLAIALGGLSQGYSPLQLTEAYSSFANNGSKVEAYTIDKILNREGEVIHEHSKNKTNVFSPQVAWYMTEMLQTAVKSGTASSGVYDKALAGKTGTHGHPSNKGNAHVWFAGYTPEYSGALWMGYDQADKGSWLNGSSAYPTALMKNILNKIDQQKSLTTSFQKPDGVEALPPPIQLPVINNLEGQLNLAGLALLKGTLTWTPAEDERVVYRIYREEEGDDVKVGEVTGEGRYQVSAFSIFDQTTYYIIPVDPLTGKEGEPSNTVKLSWDL
ncbi:PBP1A family penicillin-binding protein [Halobacillus yeomjeoni]